MPHSGCETSFPIKVSSTRVKPYIKVLSRGKSRNLKNRIGRGSKEKKEKMPPLCDVLKNVFFKEHASFREVDRDCWMIVGSTETLIIHPLPS